VGVLRVSRSDDKSFLSDSYGFFNRLWAAQQRVGRNLPFGKEMIWAFANQNKVEDLVFDMEQFTDSLTMMNSRAARHNQPTQEKELLACSWYADSLALGPTHRTTSSLYQTASSSTHCPLKGSSGEIQIFSPPS
jgi:hypothetical protein